MKPQTELNNLLKKYQPNVKYWDCYNDEPLDQNYTARCVVIHCNKILKEFQKLYSEISDNRIIRYIDHWNEVKKLAQKL